MADSSCCVITTQKRLKLFSGRSNPALAEKIAEKLDIQLGGVQLRTFANGEIYARYEENVRGTDLFIVTSPCGKGHINDEVMELLINRYSHREIADTLFISLKTVETHIYHIYQKTNTKNRQQLLKILSENPS